MTEHCPKCGGEIREGIALMDNKPNMGIPDFAGNTVDSRGQTVTLQSDGVPVKCLKCAECGYSLTNECRQ